MIEILHGGLLSTIQDYGRFGYRKYGVPISGAMDWYALRVANILVGNPERAAGIEVTFCGLVLKTTKRVLIAITGGDLSAKINDKPIPMWVHLWLEKGDILSFPRLKCGLRAYVAVRGGINVPLIMGSCSTMVKLGMGGALKTGDTLYTGEKKENKKIILKPLPDQYVPKYRITNQLAVILGPQDNYFSFEALEIFLNSEYTITSQSDRQGYRLNGPQISHLKGFNIITEPVWPGAIQVPGDGLPIILLADAQTTGGCPKIASVISVDMDKLGQAKPGDKITFKRISLDTAHCMFLEKEKTIKTIKNIFYE